MNIHEIAEATSETSPYFFSKNTLDFFGQKMEDFTVEEQTDGRFRISAKEWNSPDLRDTVRYFNPENNELEME